LLGHILEQKMWLVGSSRLGWYFIGGCLVTISWMLIIDNKC
jgi:hypothetical protein